MKAGRSYIIPVSSGGTIFSLASEISDLPLAFSALHEF